MRGSRGVRWEREKVGSKGRAERVVIAPITDCLENA